ncbi:hypothetical protein MIND_01191300 [Mycena indigotica]|uniref:Uncharacterized protein n=1 Tax=Mycena indigotica TaxID=2126181 RepID=A0A8H6VT17_9AGAR|nr:uncharacterized protein MIND_01191300 [Mycena indigotica]KAF7292922.1 hypothetical protein MIND_01191300 [Mycena indigotica]
MGTSGAQRPTTHFHTTTYAHTSYPTTTNVFDGMEITEARPSTTHPTIQPERPLSLLRSYIPQRFRHHKRGRLVFIREGYPSTSFFRSTTRPIPVIMVPSRRAPLVPAPSRLCVELRLDPYNAARSYRNPQLSASVLTQKSSANSSSGDSSSSLSSFISRFNATTMEPKPRGPRKPLAAAPLQQVDSALNTDNQRNTRLLGYVGSVYLGHSMAVQEFYPDASNLAQFEQFLRAAQNWLNARPSDFPTVSDAVYDVFFSSMQDYISRSVTQIWTGYRTYMQSHLAPRLIAEADVHELLRGYQALHNTSNGHVADDNEEEEENFEDVDEEDGEGEMTDAVHSGGTIHVNPQGQVLEGEPPSGLINEEAKEHRKKFVLRHRPEHGGFTGRHLIFAIKTLLKYRLLSPLIHVLHTIVNPAVRFETSRYKMIYYVILELLEETWNHPVHGLALRRLSAKLVKALGKRKQQ